MDIKKYESKYDSLLNIYLNEIKLEEYYGYFETVNQIKFLADKKQLFLIIENDNIKNIFYEDKDKTQIRFLFEYPKEEYTFINDYNIACVSFLPLSKVDTSKPRFFSTDVILNNKEVIGLKGAIFKNLRTKINKGKKHNISILNLNSQTIKKDEIFDFLNKWVTEATNTRNKTLANINRDSWWVNYYYSNDNSNIHGIIIKDNITNSIIGFCMYELSLDKRYAISLTSKVITKYKGLSEYLYFLKCKQQFEELGIIFQNIGNIPNKSIKTYKEKYNGNNQRVCFSILKTTEEEKDVNFWVLDHIRPDK